MIRRCTWTAAACFAMVGLPTANADNIDFTHITILDHATPFNTTFDVNNIAANNAVWPERGGRGYASRSRGASTFVDFMFDQPYTLSNVTFIDRLDSGAAPPTLGGLSDYVTEFDLIFSDDATFGDADDTTILAGPFEVPNRPLEISDFVHSIEIPSVTAQYLRYDVVATEGANPGAHTFLFETSDTVTPALPELHVDRGTGEISLRNNTAGPVTFIAYDIESPTVGALDASSWTSIASSGDRDNGGSIDPTDDWMELTPPPSVDNLAEAELPGGNGATLTSGSSISLGNAWFRNPVEDLAIQIQATDGTFLETTVAYVGEPIAPGDLDFNGAIDVGDWMLFREGLGTVSPDSSIAQSYQFGDLDGDGDNDVFDFRSFVTAFDAANGPGAFAAAVPEPAGLLLCGALAGLFALKRALKQRRPMLMSLLLVGGIPVPGWSTANADNIDFTHITILDHATPFSTTLDVNNIAANNAVWPERGGRGYASRSQRADTFVDFMFDQPYTFSDVTFVDRLDSGATPPDLGGLSDYVTEFDLIFSEDATFGDADDTTVFAGPFELPNGPLEISDFVHSIAIPDVTAQYLRYDVVATEGANPGAHTFLFETSDVVPPAEAELALEVNKTTGQLTLQNPDPLAGAVDINAYQITSEAGALNPVEWTGIGGVAGFPIGDGSGNGWEKGGSASNNLLIEAFLLGSSAIAGGGEFSLGSGYNPASGAEDLVFLYSLDGGATEIGLVQYVTGGSIGVLGDYNDSGQVEQGDLDLVLLNWGETVAGLPPNWTNQRPTEGIIDQAELDGVLLNWGNTAGASSVTSARVPEPSGWDLSLGLLILACAVRAAARPNPRRTDAFRLRGGLEKARRTRKGNVRKFPASRHSR